MAVIPGTDEVIVWDLNDANQALGTGNGSQWPQRFAVGNPETGVFANYVLTMPPNLGDLFCSGHVWLPDGRLFVAGGNTRYGTTSTHYEGSEVAAIWDPTAPRTALSNYGWSFLPNMRLKRWYPTVTLIVDHAGAHRVMVAGGVESTLMHNCNMPGMDAAFNTYEVFNIGAGDWERDSNNLPRLHGGPQNSNCFAVLGEYPRMHLVSTNHAFMVGMWRGASRVRHNSFPTQQNTFGDWLQPWTGAWDTQAFRDYGSSVLVPNVGNTVAGQDLIMILGGGSSGSATVTPSVHATSGMIDGGATAPAWGLPFETMRSPRMVANAVLLPTGEILVVGGSSDYYFQTQWWPNPPRTPVFEVELYSKTSGWYLGPPQQSPRMYHSTAALLRSGKVVSAGGDIRSSDYEIYSPKGVLGVRPAFSGSWAGSGFLDLVWDAPYWIAYAPLPVGVTISRVVLMRPCSVTHHSDMDQRYVELRPDYDDDEITVDTIKVYTPKAPTSGSARGSTVAPRGFYIAFLVASNGMVSAGKWVRLQ